MQIYTELHLIDDVSLQLFVGVWHPPMLANLVQSYQSHYDQMSISTRPSTDTTNPMTKELKKAIPYFWLMHDFAKK